MTPLYVRLGSRIIVHTLDGPVDGYVEGITNDKHVLIFLPQFGAAIKMPLSMLYSER